MGWVQLAYDQLMPYRRPEPNARASTVINTEIRALWLRTGGRLTAEQTAVYRRLVVEWADAVRAERDDAVEAA